MFHETPLILCAHKNLQELSVFLVDFCTAGFKYPRTPPNPSIDFLSGDSDHVNRRTRPLGISDEVIRCYEDQILQMR